jgi:hypothetical protein
MRYKITDKTARLLSELRQAIQDARSSLGLAPPAVHAAWDQLRGRFPSDEDIRQGFVSLSEEELAALRAEVSYLRTRAFAVADALTEFPRAGRAGPSNPRAPQPDGRVHRGATTAQAA